jgi:sulfite reductase (NADPH) flavoprotein alpha-component
MSAMTVPLIPESAPFTPSQRSWLNGFFAGLLSVDPQTMAAAQAGGEPSSPPAGGEPSQDESTPWHDAALTLDQRLDLARDRPVHDQLMAAMAQLDCGACGYLCRTYSNAIADGTEKDLTRCVPGGTDTAKTLKRIWKEHGATITVSAKPAPASASAPASSAGPIVYDRKNPYPASVLAVKRLNKPGSGKDIRFVAVDIAGGPITYQPGDSLGVHPRNCYAQVNAIVRMMGWHGAEPVATRAGRTQALRGALIDDCDIEIPRDELYELLAGCATRKQEADDLRKLAAGETVEGLADDPRVIDVLARFPSARPDAQAFIAALPALQPRLYSIASSPAMFPQEVHLTVGVVRYEKGGRVRKGVASTYLADRVMDHEPIRVFVQPTHGFTMPADPDTPMIMVGPGTGIAPFRAFLQHRQARGETGRNWLFFGDQKREFDFLYEHEIKPWLDSGLLTRCDLAFSRDQQEKIYVQHRMLQQGAELWRWLREGACFYVCGDAKHMAKDVDAALRQVVAQHGAMSDEAAKAYVQQLAQEGRYKRDVY